MSLDFALLAFSAQWVTCILNIQLSVLLNVYKSNCVSVVIITRRKNTKINIQSNECLGYVEQTDDQLLKYSNLFFSFRSLVSMLNMWMHCIVAHKITQHRIWL